MNKSLLSILVAAILLASCNKNDNNETELTASVSMGTNSLNDVYYSFVLGEVKSVVRSDWDIAFSVPLQTATILINEGAGVELYCIGDTNSWLLADTSDLQSGEPRYNNKSDWNEGAFNINAGGGFNFGWGTYNMAMHSVYGDSIYIIKLTDGSYKKLFIKNRIGNPDTYVLRWADIDGSGQADTSFSAASYYNKKHFIQYSLVHKKVVEAEPDLDTWDLLFTRYVVKIPTGPAAFINYPVTGILINPLNQGVKVTGVSPENANYTDTTASFTSQADVIGWDWKVNDPITHQYSITPDVSYFIKLPDERIYRIYFKEYSGVLAGTITFNTKLVE